MRALDSFCWSSNSSLILVYSPCKVTMRFSSSSTLPVSFLRAALKADSFSSSSSLTVAAASKAERSSPCNSPILVVSFGICLTSFCASSNLLRAAASCSSTPLRRRLSSSRRLRQESARPSATATLSFAAMICLSHSCSRPPNIHLARFKTRFNRPGFFLDAVLPVGKACSRTRWESRPRWCTAAEAAPARHNLNNTWPLVSCPEASLRLLLWPSQPPTAADFGAAFTASESTGKFGLNGEGVKTGS
mmetsp:Transcript_64085/g.152833  ORF Transcript_64085/g.152833 Transcript_64085/m.152833 type:complete len:247 (-) Transcript_64085:69-809(-)